MDANTKALTEYAFIQAMDERDSEKEEERILGLFKELKNSEGDFAEAIMESPMNPDNEILMKSLQKAYLDDELDIMGMVLKTMIDRHLYALAKRL